MSAFSARPFPTDLQPDPFAAASDALPARERQAGLQLRPMGSEGKRATPVLLSQAACEGGAQSSYLQPEVSLAFDRHPVDSNSGFFRVEVHLVNRAAHVAHLPFLCLPILGLDLSPADGWTMQDVSSIRRLRRFGQEQNQTLAQGQRVHCCNISLLFTAGQGGRFEYELGNWHPLARLPDLRLTCVAGAGNYPSERLPLVVPAVALKGFLAELVVAGEFPDMVIGG